MGSHISLFAGVGMTDLAGEEAGFKTIATAELDAWNRDVLRKRYPDALHFANVENVRYGDGPWEDKIQRPLLISGGFPCQDVSSAGTGAGVANGARSGLWSEFARIIREFQPEYVLIENSAMLRSRGLDIVLHDLMDLGYDARWDCIPAAAMGAPHLRDRMFVVAWKMSPSLDEPANADECFATWIHAGGVGDPASAEPITKLPRAGTMVKGYLFEDEPQAPIKLAKQAVLAASCPGTPTGLWPTPNQRDYKDSGVKQGNRKSPNLGTMAARFPVCPATGTGFWPTPAASIPNDVEPLESWLARRARLKAKHCNGNGAGMPLGIAARMFPTPTKSDGSGGPGTSPKRTGGNNLRTQVAIEDGNGRLNPAWVEWLMGLPIGWTDMTIDNDSLTPVQPWSTEPVERTVPNGTVADRNRRLRALGNGLVWQCAAYALTMIPSDTKEH